MYTVQRGSEGHLKRGKGKGGHLQGERVNEGMYRKSFCEGGCTAMKGGGA